MLNAGIPLKLGYMAIRDLQSEVYKRRPALKAILDEHWKSTLKDYVKDGWAINQQQPDEIFLDVFKQETQRLFDSPIAQAAVEQLKTRPLVSTVDHLGICSHPFFVNSGVIYSLAFEKNEMPIVLATESVSLNNSSSRSASLLYHRGPDLQHDSFLPARLKNLPVFSAPGISQNQVDRFNAQTQSRFKNLIQDLEIGKSLVSNLSSAAAQISFKFWQKVFPSAPKMLYLPLETLVSNYLLKVLENPDDLLYRLLFTKPGRQLWQKYFGHEHTFMFWAIDENGKRQVMTVLSENPYDVVALIGSRKIYPASPLCFIVLLKVGLTCVGGFTQTSWLTEVKEKLIRIISEIGKADATNIKNIGTTNFAESSLAYLKIGDAYIAPSAADLYLSGKDYYPVYKKLSEKLTLGKSLEIAMPDIYRVIVPKIEQAIKDLPIVNLTSLAELL